MHHSPTFTVTLSANNQSFKAHFSLLMMMMMIIGIAKSMLVFALLMTVFIPEMVYHLCLLLLLFIFISSSLFLQSYKANWFSSIIEILPSVTCQKFLPVNTSRKHSIYHTFHLIVRL